MKKNFPASRHPAPKTKILEVTEENTLLNFLFSSLSHQSKTSIKSLLKHQQIVVNGKPTTQFDIPLHKGDKIEIGFGQSQ